MTTADRIADRIAYARASIEHLEARGLDATAYHRLIADLSPAPEPTATETTLIERPWGKITHDPASEWPYTVYDAQGEPHDEFTECADAFEELDALRNEARQERIEALRDEITEAMAECDDEALLNRIKALLS